MIQQENILAGLKKVKNLISKDKIAQSISELGEILKFQKEFSYLEFLNQLSASYKYMLEYALTDNNDAGRDMMLSDIKLNLDGLADELISNIESNSNPEIFYATKRLVKIQQQSLEELLSLLKSIELEYDVLKETGIYPEETIIKRENLVDNLFEKVFALPFHSIKELKLLKDFIFDSEKPEDIKEIIISALFLSASVVYDRHKLLTLIDIYDNTSDKLAARALISIILLLDKNSEIIEKDLVIGQRLEIWKDSLINYTRLRDTVMALLRTVDTTRINDRMKEDLIPGLSKLSPDLVKELSKKIKQDDLEEPEFNPEWEEMLRESGLEKKLQEFAELQNEGADIMMMPFSQLKQFPFFNKLPHWFLPFSPHHSSLKVLRNLNNSFFTSMLNVGPFCDSDKYSFTLSLNQMPSQQIDLMKVQMAGGMEQMKLEHDEMLLKLKNPDFSNEVKNYLRNLYRFYNLFRKKDEFQNLLAKPVNFINLPFIGDWLKERELVNLAAEFFFKRGYYDYSLRLFEIIADSDPEEMVFDKIGYCYQSLSRWNEAIDAYKKAEMFGNENFWRLKMMAICYRSLNQWDSAAACYNRLLENDSENLNFLFNLAICEMNLGNFRKAAELCYKFDYLKAGNTKVLQILALAEAFDGNQSKGKSVAERIIFECGIDSDFTNYFVLGTLHLNNGELKDALKFYRMMDSDPEKWFSLVTNEMRKTGLLKLNYNRLILMKEYDILSQI